MSKQARTVTANAKLSPGAVEFLDAEAERRGTTRADLLAGLVAFLRDAHENGLNCPHCNNELVVEL